MLPVLRKEDSRNSELGQETSTHQSSTDLRRGRRSVGGRSNGQSHTVGWVQGERVPFGGGLLKVAPIAQHRLSDPRCTHALHGGFELQRRLAARNNRIPIIFITAYDSDDVHIQALQAGAAGLLCKPFSQESLFQAVRSTLANQQEVRYES